ncbi:MAG TPA: type II toxin-antitoxin system VapC family toxin [Terriglobia bacterium]|nr:type II toxin-antitoxin system VapC family toxin [Terriglobia bacterium]
MLAVDTNVVVRYLARDDVEQTDRATKLIRSEQVWLSKTVLLETAWVLGATYGFAHERLAPTLRDLLGLPTVSVEDDLAVAQALDWYEQGLDLPDALHLASAGFTMRFATFDRILLRKAKRLPTPEIVSP